jgi:hypothetical protein
LTFDSDAIDHQMGRRHQDVRRIFRLPALFSAPNSAVRWSCPITAKALDDGSFVQAAAKNVAPQELADGYN